MYLSFLNALKHQKITFTIFYVFLFFLCHDLRLKGTDQEIMDTCLDFPQTNSKEAKSLESSKISSETTT